MRKIMNGSDSTQLVIMAILSVVLVFGIVDSSEAGAGCCLMSASSTGINVSTKILKKKIGSASIGCSGGNKSKTDTLLEIPNLLQVAETKNIANGGGGKTNSQSTVKTVFLTAGLNTISVLSASSTAKAECGSNVTAQGNSTIQGLVVNGTPVLITGNINQEIPIVGGKIIVNQQKVSGTGCVRNISVTALKIQVPNIADVTLGSSSAGIACIQFTCSQ